MNFATAALNAMLMEAIQREANLRVQNLAQEAQIAELSAQLELAQATPKKGPRK